MSKVRARIPAIIGSAVFLVIAPGTLAAWLPWTLTRWRMAAPFFGLWPLRPLGGVLLALGIVGLLDSFRRFAVEGLGTPAPIAPPRTLVVSGLYRFVRNPMYCAVVVTIVGQALLLGSERLLSYGAVLWLGFHLFVLLYEEPHLRASFGDQYDRFCANVPRWVPRPTPWNVGGP